MSGVPVIKHYIIRWPWCCREYIDSAMNKKSGIRVLIGKKEVFSNVK